MVRSAQASVSSTPRGSSASLALAKDRSISETRCPSSLTIFWSLGLGSPKSVPGQLLGRTRAVTASCETIPTIEVIAMSR